MSALLNFAHPTLEPERSLTVAQEAIALASITLLGPPKPEDLEPLTFKEFVQQAWHILEPSTELSWNWSIDAIIEHLVAVTEGDIQKLVINVPPGSMKSLLTAVLWPMWTWGEVDPASRWLFSSYEATLTIRDSLKCRRLIRSEWYQRRYGHVFQILKEEDNKRKFENNKTGFRQCLTPRGGGTGNRAGYIVCLPYDGLMSTEIGPMSIGDIVEKRLALKVRGYDHATGEQVWTKIVNHQRNPYRPFVKIRTPRNEIELTDEHEVYVMGRGYICAASVMVGDRLIADSPLSEFVCSVERSPRVEPYTYNIETETHNYFAQGLLVHNCDDPHKVTEALSEKKRQFTLDWWNTEMSNRGTDKHARFVVIMQRVHEFDVAGNCIEMGYDLLRIPQEFEPLNAIVTGIGWKDPRVEDKELMWPDRFDAKFIESQQDQLGAYGYSGQHQQRPTPAEGGIIRREYLEDRYDMEVMPKYDAVLASADTAERPGVDNAYSVFIVLGVSRDKYYVLDVYRKKVDQPTLKEDFYNLCIKWKPNIALVEDKSSGVGLIQYGQKETRINIIPIKPDRDKISRLINESPSFKAQKVVLPKTGQAPWLFDVVDELTSAPNGEYMDICDSFSQALRYLREEWQPMTGAAMLRGKKKA